MINHVRNTVLTVLNKENRGFLTPEQFNLYAKHAQQLLFDQYFSEYSRLIALKNARRISKDQGDRLSVLRSNIDKFVVSEDYTPCVTYTFACGSTASDDCSWSAYDCDGNATTIDIAPGESESHTVKANPTSTTTGNRRGTETPTKTWHTKPDDLYSEMSLIYNGKTVEYIPTYKKPYLEATSFAKPSDLYPAYSVSNEKWYMNPVTLTDDMNLVYIRKPKDPKWTYTTVGENPVHNPSAIDFQDFELGPDDETKLVLEILKLSGLTIREADITQAASGIDQQQFQKENA